MITENCDSCRSLLRLINDAIDCLAIIERYQCFLTHASLEETTAQDRDVLMEAYEDKMIETLPDIRLKLEAAAAKLKRC